MVQRYWFSLKKVYFNRVITKHRVVNNSWLADSTFRLDFIVMLEKEVCEDEDVFLIIIFSFYHEDFFGMPSKVPLWRTIFVLSSPWLCVCTQVS